MPTRPGQRFAGKHNNLPVEPDTVADADDAVPSDIVEDLEKLDWWNFLKADLEKRNYWSPTYQPQIQQFVHAICRLHQIRRKIDEEGLTVPLVSAKGLTIGEKKHPLLDSELQWSKEVRAHMSSFGMNPKDIVFLSQTDPTPDQVIDAVVADRRVQYFRD